MGLIGVKRLESTRFQKRDLLLFDQIAIPDLSNYLSKQSDESLLADYEWLAEKGIIFEIDEKETVQKLCDQGDPTAYYRVFSQTIIIISAVLNMKSSSKSTDIDSLAKRGLQDFLDFSLRTLAIDIEQNRNVRAIPVLHSSPHNTVNTDERKEIIEKIIRRQDVFLAKVKLLGQEDQSTALEAFEIFLFLSNKYLKDQRVDINNAKSDCSNVTSVILTAMPFPDESVPFEKIIDFKMDEKTKIHMDNLHNWIKKIAKENYSPMELNEELEFLINAYNDHMKFHKLKSQPSIIETLIFIPLHIAEHMVKIKWGEISKELFTLKKRKIELLEAERSAPGREIAYIEKARREFGK